MDGGRCRLKYCYLSGWGDWGDCSTSCGESGMQTRTRVKLMSERCGGGCWNLTQKRACNRKCCPSSCQYSYTKWSECKGCGNQGLRHRTLTITRQATCGAPPCPRAGPYLNVCKPPNT